MQMCLYINPGLSKGFTYQQSQAYSQRTVFLFICLVDSKQQ